ncbi:DUF4352 domain-containing protein [Pontibacillus salipaludis]|uniref:DUF4352 domain-containing protein n=1 Tax=Pontibacillus salipaludis TaxID=1697394 RepID=A0ABQ1QCQ2_9BACI|nr:DUF4352 domain-containing protein [Pontibacillus salipaludis]GGD21936.1 hypothetical protein GCM10011389_32010 [Pontibacillus salipaludis]
MRGVLNVLITSLILLIIASGCSDDIDANPSDESDSNPKEGLSKNDTNKDVYYSIGESHHFKTPIGNYKMTLESVEFAEKINGEVAQSGLFVIPTFIIENTGDSSISVEDAFSTFDLLTKVSKKSSIIQVGDEDIWSETIEPGQIRTGQVYYVIEGKSYTLQSDYITSDMKNKRVGWKFSREN